jgi:hypothetical protein
MLLQYSLSYERSNSQIHKSGYYIRNWVMEKRVLVNIGITFFNILKNSEMIEKNEMNTLTY